MRINTKDLTIKDIKNRLSVKNKHPSWAFSNIRILNRDWNKILRTYPCQVCLYDKHIELAHIKAIKDFDENTKLSVVNDASNILVLCPNHHWEFDNGLLSIADIPDRSLIDPIRKNETPFKFKVFCINCAGGLYKKSITGLCRNCYIASHHPCSYEQPAIKWIDSEELRNLVWEKPTTEIAKMLGVSDKAVEKRCKKLGIPKPPRGYWGRLNGYKNLRNQTTK